MINQDSSYDKGARFNIRAHRIISVVLISLMMASVGITAAQFGTQIVPGWDGWYLAIIGLLIALERFYSHRALIRLTVFSREWFVLLSTQWVVNLIVIKLIVTLSSGVNTLISEIPRWEQSFGDTFFEPSYLIAVIFAILVWTLVGRFTESLETMGLNPDLIAREFLMSAAQEQRTPRQRLMATVFAVGACLMFITAMGRVNIRLLFAYESGVLRTDLSPLEAGGAGTLLYFLFGLALLSQAQYITLNTRWSLQGVPVSRSIAANWAIYSVGFLIIILLIVSVLPTSYSLGLLSVLGYLIYIIYRIIILIVAILLAILTFFASLLFGGGAATNFPTMSNLPPPMAPSPPSIEQTTSIPWVDLLKSLLFWGVFLAVIGYSVSQYLRQHEDILASLRKIPGWQLLASFWNWITGMFRGLNQRVSNVIKIGRERLRPQGDSINIRGFSRFTRFRNLSPRQKVFFYYHALIHRGEETNLSRQISQTPEEYAETLEHSLPTVENEIDSLTESFNKARYSHHLVETKDADSVKSYWEKIRRVFRGQRS